MPLSGAAMISENTAAASSSRCTGSLFFARSGARAKVVIRTSRIFYPIPIDRGCPRGRLIDIVFSARAMPSLRRSIHRFLKHAVSEGRGRFRPATSGKTSCSRATFKKRRLIGAAPSGEQGSDCSGFPAPLGSGQLHWAHSCLETVGSEGEHLCFGQSL